MVSIHYAQFPEAWPPVWKAQWDDTMTVAIATDPVEALSWMNSAQWAATQELASEVTSLKFSVSPEAPLAEMVQIEVTVGSGPGAVELRSSASMRAHKIADLYMDGGVYYLAAPE
ncbi:MAG: hypothetical protein HN350_19075 [Phycisphaerales bacterium]|nr:hypothetical protein [Phycisphaerales bacterium]